MPFPLLGLALGLGAFAPQITKWLHSEKKDTVAESVVAVAKAVTGISNGQELLSKLRDDQSLRQEFQYQMEALSVSLEQSYLQDRADARSRDMAIQSAVGSNARADVMVISAALGLVLCLGSLSWYAENLSGEAVGIISTVAGIFGSCLKDAYAFEFGSSRGSKEKDSTVAEIIRKHNF